MSLCWCKSPRFLKNFRHLRPTFKWKYCTTRRPDPDKVATVGTMEDLTLKLMTMMGVEKGYRVVRPSRDHLNKYLPENQDELPPRTMNDTFASAIIPLSSKLDLQDKYTTFLGKVRAGRLLEDMDLFAAYLGYLYIVNPKLPQGTPTPHVIVTAQVDQIDFAAYYPTYKEDVRLSGHVSWVGRSSIEVVVWVEQKGSEDWHSVTRALFLMAARDANAQKSAIVNRLVPSNDKEKKIIEGGEGRKKKRMLVASQHLTRVIPTTDEQRVIHDLFLRTVDEYDANLEKRTLPSGCVWMCDCTLSNFITLHPEERNLHNTVFGGFIMRQAMQLSSSLGFIFSKYKPQIKSISDVKFNRAVEVNSLLRMTGRVVFTHLQFFQITVYAEVLSTHTNSTIISNTLHFTYEVSSVVTEVIPRSYQEVMLYIDGRRHFHNVMKIQEGQLDKK